MKAPTKKRGYARYGSSCNVPCRIWPLSFFGDTIRAFLLQKATRSALYVGAGLDIRPLRSLRDIKRFVFVDSQPFSEFGSLHGYARPSFLPRLHETMEREGFLAVDDSGSSCPLLAHTVPLHGMHRFCDNRARIVEYHYNTAIEASTEDATFLSLLPRCDTLIVAGHHPHISAVTRACVPSGLHFVGFHGTSFKDDGEDTVIASLYKDPTMRARFGSFEHLDQQGTPNIQSMTWEGFQNGLDAIYPKRATLRDANM